MSARPVLVVSIDPEFRPFIGAALLRLGYIYPDLEFRVSSEGVQVSGALRSDNTRLEREVTYQVYREKIFRETLPMRQSLYEILAR